MHDDPAKMWIRHRVVLGALAFLVLCLGQAGAEGEKREPVYVGARVCASCHAGTEMGNQFSLWLLSKHSRAYATLATPAAWPMAELSGIPLEPQESAMCLGCHATAAEAEEWKKDPTFRLEDGVQCEKCHGPGSEYAVEEIMRDREAAVEAGLMMPSKRMCRLCHYEKGSHVAVHKRPMLDIDEGLRKIAHPTRDPSPGAIPAPPQREDRNPVGPAYTGVDACAGCHKGPMMGYQFSRWRLTKHARAYAILTTPAAASIAKEEGLTGDPQRSAACLSCHATAGGGSGESFLESFSLDEGVGCEACHGAGSDYSAEAIMIDRRAALASGLKPVTRETCMRCHASGHGKPFDVEKAWEAITHSSRHKAAAEVPRYKTPVNLAFSPDGSELYVACEASDTVIVVGARERRKEAEIAVGGQPNDVTFSPDGRLAYVSNRLGDSVSVIDTSTRKVVGTFPAGDDPHGLVTTRSGKHLYVLNTAADSISVIDTSTHEEVRRLSASRNPWSLSLSPDGTRILVTNTLSRFVPFRTPSMSEVTVIDAESGVVEDRYVVPETNLLQGVAWHPSGEFALITLNRTKNLIPMTRILQGWTITNGLGVIWRNGRIDQVLLDQPNMHFPDAADVAFTPDGRLALVTSSGSDRVAVVDVEKLTSMLEGADPHEREKVFPNHLAKSTEFVIRYVPTMDSPRGVTVGSDGRFAFVANALDDSLTAIDIDRLEAVERVDLGGPKEVTRARYGEQLFHSANITFQRQFSCHSCHPDGHVDGITYDIEPDGIGLNPVDNRTLRGILDTDPFKWEGTNPSLARQCGPRLAVFFTRIQPFTADELSALTTYIATIPRPPNRFRPVGAPLTEAQRRGKKVFERMMTNDGRVIPEDNRCVTCHFPPTFTDRTVRNVGLKMALDENSEFDVPHLNNIYDSAPYLHNGIAPTLEEIWTRFNPYDTHGVTNDLTKDELNDLMEYLKTL
jgi:YVTN family beta-propeller protein